MNKESWTFKNIFQRQTKLAAYIIICATLVVIGASYALFFQVDSNTNNQVVEAGDLTFTYSNETVINNSICFEPMSLDEANLYASSCSYQLSIRNTGTLIADYDLYLVPRADNTADLSNLKLILRENGSLVEGYPKGIVSGEGDSTHVGTTNSFLSGTINPSNTILYSAQIYVDDTTNFQGSENKKVSFDIRGALKASDINPITSEKPSASNTLAKLQTLNQSLTVTPSTDTDPNFNSNSPGDEDGQQSGLYEATDDYGGTYYFRGGIGNNYVSFGKWQTDYYNGYNANTGIGYGQFTTLTECESTSGSGNCTKYASAGADMYWRIIRINGDGSIRMIYDGTGMYGGNDEENGSTIFRSIGTSSYNDNDNDNAYEGYMYGSTGANTYEETHANTNNSKIKSALDSWYQSQMAQNAGYLTDTLFCNDRSVGSTDIITYLNNNWSPTVPYTSNAFGSNVTLYGGRERLLNESERNMGNQVTLRCPNKKDAFTVSDTEKGNGALTNPVGLITIDEANMAGINFDSNVENYLHIGKTFWTMSPSEYDENGGLNHAINSISYIYNDASIKNPTIAIRPVININADYIRSGSGTASNPYSDVPTK